MPRNIQIHPVHILLLPAAILFGLVGGMLAGAVWLPYIVLREVMRRLEEQIEYLRGWTAWSENWDREGKKGWLAVWFLWLAAWGFSAATWAALAGTILGPLAACYVLIVPGGWDRLCELWQRALDRVRRSKVEFRIVDRA